MIHSGRRERGLIYILVILLCLVLASFWLMCNIYARYTSEASGSDEARVALWGSNQSIMLAEENMLPKCPGDSCSYTLLVSNQSENGKISEVTQKYNIEVITAGNLPLMYSVRKDSQEIATFQETPQNKIWNISNENMVFQSGTADAHTYILTVTWPAEQNSASFAGVPDFIQINIFAEQMD